MVLLPTVPDFPGPGPPSRWGYDINQTHQIISRSYSQALHVLHQEDSDFLHLKYHLNFLQGCICYLLRTLGTTDLPVMWLETCAFCLGQLLVEPAIAMKGAEDTYVYPTC